MRRARLDRGARIALWQRGRNARTLGTNRPATGPGRLAGRGDAADGGQNRRGLGRFRPARQGLEIPGYEPRALQTMALGFAVGSRGADHNRSGAYEVDFSSRADRLQGSPEA